MLSDTTRLAERPWVAGVDVRLRIVEASFFIYTPFPYVRHALELLRDILTRMSQGNAPIVMFVHAELTTRDAANLLNLSRPHPS